jgi:hypothetical protein
MLCGMSKSVQAELDLFFAHLRQRAQLVHRCICILRYVPGEHTPTVEPLRLHF